MVSIRQFRAAVAIVLAPALAVGQSLDYRFERLWPGLQQPWYYAEPGRVAVDADGFIYVMDYRIRHVYKLAGDGRVVKDWVVSPLTSPNGARGGKQTTSAHSDDGFLYMSDMDGLITKYTTDGEFVTTWGSEISDGTGPGQFQYTGQITGGAQGIATDAAGDVYVADPNNHRVQKFTSSGTYLTEWGTQGAGPGAFEFPSDVAFDRHGFAYVVDRVGKRIQKFAPPPGGARDQPFGYVTEFPAGFGSSSTQVRMEFDANDVLYLAVRAEDVLTFTPPLSGQPQDPHSAAVALTGPSGVDIAILGSRLVLGDIGSSTVGLYLPTGLLLARYAATGTANRFFGTSFREDTSPGPIAVGGNGDIYVSDPGNERIQVFDSSGRHLRNISDIVAYDLVVDSSGPSEEILVRHELDDPVLPRTITVSRYATDGALLDSWPTIGTKALPRNGFYDASGGLAVDSAGNVYVAVGTDLGNSFVNARTVQRYTAAGNLLAQWGDTTYSIRGLAMDSQDRLYVSENLFEVQRFVPPAEGVSSTAPHVFDITIPAPGNLGKVAVDGSNNLLVVSSSRDSVLRYDPDGNETNRIGEAGRLAGQVRLRAMNGVAIAADGSVYVSDGGNRRVQKFREVITADNARAIVVAGGGPYPGNALWAATEVNTNFIYRTLVTQGFNRETIQYLSDNVEFDLDQNGEFDDVDTTASSANLQDAILGTFATAAEELLLVLVDHGGLNSFRISATEIVTASELGGWLDQWQASRPGSRVTVVYDACQSGSFLDELRNPAVERVLIASTGADENAYFVSQGALSFSNQFWTGVFNGLAVGSAFTLASNSQNASFPRQVAMLDADGDGVVNSAADLAAVQTLFVGNGAVSTGEIPVIGSVSSPQVISGGNQATISAANVSDSDGISRVWAVMRPPGFNPGSPDNPVNELPSFDLSPVGGGDYQATYGNFSDVGSYQLTVYARDTLGNTAVPQPTSVTVDNPLVRRSVIIAGGESGDALFDSVSSNAQMAYNALSAQGYGTEDAVCDASGGCDFSCDNVCYLTNASGTGFDATPTLGNIAMALENWGVQDTQDLTVYLVAEQAGDDYRLSSAASLSASQLKSHLDAAQASIAGKLTVVVEGTDAEPFAAALAAGSDRILIASSATGELTDLNQQGHATFSNYFWNQVANGATVRSAYQVASAGVQFSACPRNPGLDDSGNGVFNEPIDGLQARNYAIGSGVLLAGDDPVIGNVVSSQFITAAAYELVVENVTSTGAITGVTALVADSNGCRQEVPLSDAGSGRWSVALPELTLDSDPAEISVIAVDDAGVASAPSRISVVGDRILFSGFETPGGFAKQADRPAR